MLSKEIKTLIKLAITEDLGKGDITSKLVIPFPSLASADIITRENIVVAGMDVVGEILKQYDRKLRLNVRIGDGKKAKTGQSLASITGPASAMLSAERVVLNFLQHLCGIATITSRYVEAIDGSDASIYDTRKTTPGFRTLEKYAVLCGGGKNHRIGLFDAILIKDNHIASMGDDIAGKLTDMVAKARKMGKIKFFEVEVDSIEQLTEVLKVKGVDIVLLDNFSPAQMRKAVSLRNKSKTKPQLEASGGITLKTVKAVAHSGVERISVGAITHSAPAVDIGLDIL
jgi:nicotinate-nucleotide pyrophosphorylase (carboxylating)